MFQQRGKRINISQLVRRDVQRLSLRIVPTLLEGWRGRRRDTARRCDGAGAAFHHLGRALRRQAAQHLACCSRPTRGRSQNGIWKIFSK